MRKAVLVLISMSLILLACTSGQQGGIQGTVSPAAEDVLVTVKAGAATVAVGSADAHTGVFSIPLNAGTYDISVASAASSFPVVFSGVTVGPGKSVSLGVIQLTPTRGTASIRGHIVGGKAARISLLLNARERAAAVTDPSGNYELKELPPGDYTLKVHAQDYAEDSRSVALEDGQQTAVNIRLLHISALDGVDWARGTVKTRGVGTPPPQAATPTVRREMAKRAALAVAERDMLRVLGLIETAPGENVSQLLEGKAFSQTLAGYLSGFHIAAERDLDGGRVEIEIELPLTGSGGLTSYLPAE